MMIDILVMDQLHDLSGQCAIYFFIRIKIYRVYKNMYLCNYVASRERL